MNKLDLIINALELCDPDRVAEALAAARELRDMKPVAYYNKEHGTVITAYELGKYVDENDIPLYMDKQPTISNAGSEANTPAATFSAKGSGMVELRQPDHGFDRTASHMAGEYVDTAEQEPIAWMYNGNLHECDPSDWALDDVIPLYAAPPRKEWVGLTEEEEIELDEKYGDDFNAYIEARDAKQKEKNT